MKRGIHKGIKYPKLLLLLVSFIIALIIFYMGNNYNPIHDFLISLGYLGILIAGVFYAYGFTAAPATAVLLIMAEEHNLILAGLIGGLGALFSDLLIFLVIRYSFMDEIKKFEREKIIKYIEREEKIIFGHYCKYILPVFSGFLIASPLPTEIGVTLLATIKRFSLKKFIILAYILHTLGILVILGLGNL